MKKSVKTDKNEKKEAVEWKKKGCVGCVCSPECWYGAEVMKHAFSRPLDEPMLFKLSLCQGVKLLLK